MLMNGKHGNTLIAQHHDGYSIILYVGQRHLFRLGFVRVPHCARPTATKAHVKHQDSNEGYLQQLGERFVHGVSFVGVEVAVCKA